MVFSEALKAEVSKTKTLTENGAVAYESSGKLLLDFNFAVTALRNAESDAEITQMFSKAFYEDPAVAVQFLFWLRDCRGGLGERRIFRACFKWLVDVRPEVVKATLGLVPEYGRFDDLWPLLDTDARADVIEFVGNTLAQDGSLIAQGKPSSIILKWMPSINTSSKKTRHYAEVIRKALGMTSSEYRKVLSAGRRYLDVVERKMSSGEWSQINYSTVPSKANLIYKDAFMRHDEERRTKYLDSLQKGETKINAGVLQPHEIVHDYIKNYSGYYWDYNKNNTNIDPTLEELWKALPDVTIDDCLVVRDGSGSMTGGYGTTVRPLDVATALAIYMSEHNSEAWKDKFITFSSRPKFVDLGNCETLREKINVCMDEDECSNTNIEATMMLILNTAISNHMDQEDMPKRILILSDMQFDMASNCGYWARNKFKSPSKALFEEIAEIFNAYGYDMPKIVFWNLSGNVNKTIPMQENKLGVVLCSGFSVQLMQMVMSGETDPYKVLLDTINVPRYAPVKEALKGIL